MELIQKLTILSDAAKYDAACTSSGVNRTEKGRFGSCAAAGICHSFSSDGRCISLLKILLTNVCSYDCAYCANRAGNDIPRATFTPREVADLTMNFYKRNYIEGLFLSSAVPKNADHTMEQLIQTLTILRYDYGFFGYIHAKTIPGASPEAIRRLGYLADRISVNIEMPSEKSLSTWAPQKSRAGILQPMGYITRQLEESRLALAGRREEPKALTVQHWQKQPVFAAGGQSTQMIVGASPEHDCHIVSLAQGLYRRYGLKRVFYSAYLPVNHDPRNGPPPQPPLLREHRLYQADWLLRFYGFEAEELFTPAQPDLDPLVDPKCGWALRHPELFPVEINRADKETLLRVPGIGVTSALRILAARRYGALDYSGLKKIGVVLKRAKYFIVCSGKQMESFPERPEWVRLRLADNPETEDRPEQLSFFPQTAKEELQKCLTGQL